MAKDKMHAGHDGKKKESMSSKHHMGKGEGKKKESMKKDCKMGKF